MNKDFSKKKLLSFNQSKQIKILYDLASFIETNQANIESSHFQKLIKYHTVLDEYYHSNKHENDHDKIQKLNKEFFKVKELGHQFQIYLMNLERLLGQSKKEYDFLVSTKDMDTTKNSDHTQKFPITCLLDSVRSAHNVGAMFRNAECFGVSKLLLCGLTPTPENIQVQKTAMGCERHIEWKECKNALEIANELKANGHSIWAIETSPHSTDLNEISDLPEKLVVIFGHEQFGISLELMEISDKIISIPTYGVKNSLNVSCGQAVILNQLANLSSKKLEG